MNSEINILEMSAAVNAGVSLSSEVPPLLAFRLRKSLKYLFYRIAIPLPNNIFEQ
jgi:hypothetical protein